MGTRGLGIGVLVVLSGCQLWKAEPGELAEAPEVAPVTVYEPYVTDPGQVLAPMAPADLNGIAAAVQQQMPLLESCYAGGLAKDPSLQAEVAIHFSVDDQGDLVEACISSEDAPPVLADCMNQLVQTAQFPPTQGQPVDVTLPVRFGT